MWGRSLVGLLLDSALIGRVDDGADARLSIVSSLPGCFARFVAPPT